MFLTIVVVLLIISVLVTIHEFGHYITARKFGMKVEEFAVGMGPAIFKYVSKKTNILYSIRCIPIGGFCKIKGEDGEIKDTDSFGSKKIWQRAIVLSAGVIMNFIFTILLVYVGLIVGMPDVINENQTYDNVKLSHERILVRSVLPESVVSKAGFKSGDEISSVNGQKILDTQTLSTTLNNTEAVSFVLKDNNGKERVINNLSKEFNSNYNKEIFGIDFVKVAVLSYNPLAAIPKTFQTIGYFSVEMFKGLGYIISSVFMGHGLPEGLAGPVGITFITSEAMRQGISYLLYIIAQISLNLAIINIIPFPALDGGRILFLVFEKIKGGPLNEKFELIANGVGFLLLMAMIITVTFKDIGVYILK